MPNNELAAKYRGLTYSAKQTGNESAELPTARSKLVLYPFKNILDFTTAGDWDCVAAVEHLPALHYSVDFIVLSFGIMGFILEL